MILAENNVVFPNSDSKITINTYKIRLGQKLRMLPNDKGSWPILFIIITYSIVDSKNPTPEGPALV